MDPNADQSNILRSELIRELLGKNIVRRRRFCLCDQYACQASRECQQRCENSSSHSVPILSILDSYKRPAHRSDSYAGKLGRLETPGIDPAIRNGTATRVPQTPVTR
jgi:hypothetical protein